MSRFKKLSMKMIADYVSCPMKFKYSKIIGIEEDVIDYRELYGSVIKGVIFDYIAVITTKKGVYSWDRMIKKWNEDWSRQRGKMKDEEFVKYLAHGYTACRYFYDLETAKDIYVGYNFPFRINMKDFTIADHIDIIRVTNHRSTKRRRVQLISLFPGNLGWNVRDKALSVVMMTYRIAMKEMAKVLGQGEIQGYDYIWFDSCYSLFHNCNHGDVPEKASRAARAYLANIARGVKNDVFYPRFEDSTCSKCCFRDTCSVDHVVPYKSAQEIYRIIDQKDSQ